MSTVYSFKVARLVTMISAMEGQSFGEALRVATIGEKLCVDAGGWKDIRGFEFPTTAEQELARKFCEDFDKATAPIRRQFANDLRRLLAEECEEQRVRAMDMPGETQ